MCGRGYDCAARSSSAMSSFFIFIMTSIALGCLRSSGRRRDDLPAQAELVTEPAALDLAAAGSELRPIVVHFLLRFAANDKGDRFGELVLRSAVERGELQSVEPKRNGEDAAFRAGASPVLRSSLSRRELGKMLQ